MMNFQALGIDISKNKFDIALIRDIGSSKVKTKALSNQPDGFRQLTTWLYKNIGEDLSQLKIFMEATGVYHEALAEYLHQQGLTVYLLNPADAAHYARYDSLHKTDKADSQLLARAGIDQHIDRHPDLKQDRALLRSIPRVGEVVSLRMTALYHSKSFTSASQMAAYLGLVPKQRESGQHKGKAMLSKRGNPVIRAKLYLAAVVAKTWNPDINAHYRRLKAGNKTEMQTIGVAMRRLVQICFGVLKHQCKYQAKTTLAA